MRPKPKQIRMLTEHLASVERHLAELRKLEKEVEEEYRILFHKIYEGWKRKQSRLEEVLEDEGNLDLKKTHSLITCVSYPARIYFDSDYSKIPQLKQFLKDGKGPSEQWRA